MTSSGGDFFEKARRAMPSMPAVVPGPDVELEDDEEHPASEPASAAPVQDSFDEQTFVLALEKSHAPPPRFELDAEVEPPPSLAQDDQLDPPPALQLDDEYDDPSQAPA